MSSLTRKIAEGTALFASSNLITSLVGFLTFLVIVRTLGRLDYGLVVLALSAIGIVTIFLDPGIGGVIITDATREIGENKQSRAKNLLVRYAQFEIFAGILIFVAVFSANNYFEAKYSGLIANLVKIASFMVLLTAIRNIYITTFNSHMEFKYTFLTNTVQSVSRLLFVILFLWIFKLGVYGAMISYPASMSTSILFTTPLFLRVTSRYREISMEKGNLLFRTLKAHGKWVIALIPFKRAGGHAPPWLIQLFLGVEAVALFQVAQRTASLISSLIHPLESVLMPVISREIHDEARVSKIVSKSIKYSFWLALVVISGALIAAPPLFDILFGSGYNASILLFRILMFNAAIYSFSVVIRPILYGLKAQKYLFRSYAVFMLIFIIAGATLIPILGLTGIGLAVLIRGLVALLLRYRYVKMLSEIRINIADIIRFDDYDRELLRKVRTHIRKRLKR
ncbi:MAG: lipopolysaccharide biosynthesis protein [Candidatus Bipolaricaulia bacterium]